MKNENHKMQYLDEIYENLSPLGKTEEKPVRIFLVRHKQTGKIAVKKYVDFSTIPIYEKISRIQNIHLEKIYDYAGDGIWGIVITEFISGITLQEYMNLSGPLEMQTACHMLQDLLEVLIEVHGQGIVHRDITPDNIMVSNDGVLKLIDFGIARQKKEKQQCDTAILGTAGYAAPEQYGFYQTDERTDIYALGVLLNKLLTGSFPNEKKYGAGPLKEIIERSIAMDPGMRFQNAQEMLTAVKVCVSEGTPLTRTNTSYKNGDCRENITVWWLPGFRTGKIWKNVVATIGYLCMLFYSVIGIYDFFATWQSCLLEILALFLYVWSAPLVTANVWNWDRCIWPFKKWPKAVTIVIRVFLCIILFYAGISLENYVRYELLGMPIPNS